MATNRPRFLISVSQRMLDDIEEFMKDTGCATRSGAIQELIRLGLDEIQKEEFEKKLEERSKSNNS